MAIQRNLVTPIRISQQTSASVQPIGRLASTPDVPSLSQTERAVRLGTRRWLLDGTGWNVLRPTVDLLALYTAVAIALGGLGAATHASAFGVLLLAFPPLVMTLFLLRGHYHGLRRRALILDEIAPIVSSVSVAAMAVALIAVFANGRLPNQGQWVRSWLYALLALALGRMAMDFGQHWERRRRPRGKPALIMGAGLVGSQVARRLENHPEYGLRPIGFLDEAPRPASEVGGRDLPVLGTVDDLDRVLEQTRVEEVIVAFASERDARISHLIRRCQELGIRVSVVPRMFDTINDRVVYDAIGGLPLLSFHGVDPKGAQFAVKHALDRIAAVLLLLALSPVIALIALAVRLNSPGPVLFRQRRVGRDGTEFDLYKFRSMRPAPERVTPPSEADLDTPDQPLGADIAPGGVEGEDRRTFVGRLLRRTSLDELPQLINVLRGDMSLIGPRPERPEFVEMFGRDVARYDDRHRVKSGITGWAQVHRLRGHTSLAERVEWDNYYIAHWSLGLDVKILMLTLLALFHDAE